MYAIKRDALWFIGLDHRKDVCKKIKVSTQVLGPKVINLAGLKGLNQEIRKIQGIP